MIIRVLFLFGILLAAVCSNLFLSKSTIGAGPLKVCFIYLTSIGDHGWTFAHDIGRQKLQKHFGGLIQTKYKINVPEGIASREHIRSFAKDGCAVIFTTSFGYMDATVKVAKEFPNIKFVHMTGYKRLSNLATGDIRYYEGSYIKGIVAGLMTKTNKLGFVASFPIPNTYQEINAFAIGARESNG